MVRVMWPWQANSRTCEPEQATRNGRTCARVSRRRPREPKTEEETASTPEDSGTQDRYGTDVNERELDGCRSFTGRRFEKA